MSEESEENYCIQIDTIPRPVKKKIRCYESVEGYV
jgi:hypothetical protein